MTVTDAQRRKRAAQNLGSVSKRPGTLKTHHVKVGGKSYPFAAETREEAVQFARDWAKRYGHGEVEA